MSCLTRNVSRYLVVPRSTTRVSRSICDNSRRGLPGSRMISALSFLGRIFARQANVYVNNRIRRASDIYQKYHRVFCENHVVDTYICNVFRRVAKRWGECSLLSATAVFSFKHEGITDAEVERCIGEFEILKERPQVRCALGKSSSDGLQLENFIQHLKEDGYECVISSDNLHIWRKSEAHLANYKYKVFGTFTDISAKNFFEVQCNMEYRRKWDKLVVDLKIIESDQNNEVIYWQMKYPFPMKSRDYVFVRRNLLDGYSGCMVLVSHATRHPECPERKKIVRVDQYMSDMVISPHGSPDQNGFDFLLTYYDDPQSSFPSPVYSWMASSGVYDYMERLHKATKLLNESSTVSVPSTTCSTTERSNETTTSPVQHTVPMKQYA